MPDASRLTSFGGWNTCSVCHLYLTRSDCPTCRKSVCKFCRKIDTQEPPAVLTREILIAWSKMCPKCKGKRHVEEVGTTAGPESEPAGSV